MKNITIISLVIAAALIISAFIFAGGTSTERTSVATAGASNISMAEGKQIVEISAKGGYSPRVSYAKAGIATTIRLKTNGTFDCSSYVVIPSVGFRDSLPQTGERNVELPPQKSGAVIQGICGMGMYNFQIHFD